MRPTNHPFPQLNKIIDWSQKTCATQAFNSRFGFWPMESDIIRRFCCWEDENGERNMEPMNSKHDSSENFNQYWMAKGESKPIMPIKNEFSTRIAQFQSNSFVLSFHFND